MAYLGRSPHPPVQRRTILRLLAVIAGLAAGVAQPAAADSPDSAGVVLRKGERIVWIGGTFVERMQQDNYLEAILSAALAEHRLTFRNLGWSGDTVRGESRGVFGGPAEGFARLVKDTLEAQPTLLIVQYGANEAIRGAEGVPEFVTGLDRLLDALAESKARVLLVSPCPREKMPAPLPDPTAYNEQLKLYDAAIREVAQRRNCGFVSLADVYQNIPAPWIAPSSDFRFTDNGLHPRPAGAYLLAASIAAKLGVRWPAIDLTIDARNLRVSGTGAKITELARKGTQLQFTVTDLSGSLPPPPERAAGARQPLIQAANLKISGLPAGQYLLDVDGQTSRVTAADLQAGMRLVSQRRDERGEQLRQAIAAKNELYFHRYRPQNETYLFLFRKHEQGQNAVEIPQFDPLVAQAERRIFELAQPLRQHVKISPVE